MSSKACDSRLAVRPPAAVDALLTSEQVARRGGLSRGAVCKAIERGELAATDEFSRGDP